MAITNTGYPNGELGDRFDYMGESTDTKPTEGIGENSRFFELDTGKKYYFNGTTWKEVGWNA